MKRRLSVMVAGLALAVSASPHAQTPTGLTADLLKDITDTEAKLVALAGAMSTEQYSWRPGAGVRSVGEVLLHIGSDNYFLPAAWGFAAPAATKITATDYSAVQAFEKQQLSKEATIAALKTSFEHFRKGITAVPESRMNERLNVFGQEFTMRGFLVLSTTHLHEHLGQLIAYARMNGVVPPWSR